MAQKQVEVYAPASIANLGPGFDAFALALEGLGDVLRLELMEERGVSISVMGIKADSIPLDPRANSAGAVLRHLIEHLSLPYGFYVEIEKGIPPSKGLGSSGASAAAAAYAAMEILGLSLSTREMVRLAAVGEEAVSGSPHADNVSASLLGGFTIVSKDYEVLRLEPPELELTIVVPEVHYENKTRLARELLPREVGLREAVVNLSYASKMAAAELPSISPESLSKSLLHSFSISIALFRKLSTLRAGTSRLFVEEKE